MKRVRFFIVMSNSLLSLPKRMGRVDGLSKGLHGKRIHRVTCRVRAPPQGRPLGRVSSSRTGYSLGWFAFDSWIFFRMPSRL